MTKRKTFGGEAMTTLRTLTGLVLVSAGVALWWLLRRNERAVDEWAREREAAMQADSGEND